MYVALLALENAIRSIIAGQSVDNKDGRHQNQVERVEALDQFAGRFLIESVNPKGTGDVCSYEPWKDKKSGKGREVAVKCVTDGRTALSS